jgi:hypothetical protein
MTATATMTARPPTTPPTTAPMGTDEWEGDEVDVGFMLVVDALDAEVGG